MRKGVDKMKYNDYILKLTNKARQQKLTPIESGILADHGAVSELRKQKGVGCMEHDLTHTLACGVCLKDLQSKLAEVEKERDKAKELTMEYFLMCRGVETPCSKCVGFGVRAYGSTATWRGGIGGQTVTQGICDHCWGSGDEHRKGANLRIISATEAVTARYRKALEEIQIVADKYAHCGDADKKCGTLAVISKEADQTLAQEGVGEKK
jgi:hypothetical protein